MEGLIDWTHTRRALGEYGDAVAQAYKGNLVSNGRPATGALISSVAVEVLDETGGGISVALDLASYWKYVEWDTRPHWPPPGVLLDWIAAKPILPSPDSRGRIPTPEHLDFLIRRKIAGRSPSGKPGGTRGSHDLEEAIDALNGVWLPRLEDAIAQDIDDFTTAQLWVLFGHSGR